jgi:hypothetical protein
MKTIDIDNTLIDGYLELLENLSPSNKLDLISKLTNSVKSDITNKRRAFDESFGAWESTETADELIAMIRSSRTFNRDIEKL